MQKERKRELSDDEAEANEADNKEEDKMNLDEQAEKDDEEKPDNYKPLSLTDEESRELDDVIIKTFLNNKLKLRRAITQTIFTMDTAKFFGFVFSDEYMNDFPVFLMSVLQEGMDTNWSTNPIKI
ncbi:hypothetical protein GJ496_009947 [Pomphorhynchus laevis]|nr:hypothetical protein GJ496_009947 [Pomphorhynchus laevis]